MPPGHHLLHQGGRPRPGGAIGGPAPFFLWDSMGYAYYYIQYMLEHNIDPETVTREQVNAASDYALKKCQDDYLRDDRAIGFFGIAICGLLMLFFIFSFICALNGTPMR